MNPIDNIRKMLLVVLIIAGGLEFIQILFLSSICSKQAEIYKEIKAMQRNIPSTPQEQNSNLLSNLKIRNPLLPTQP